MLDTADKLAEILNTTLWLVASAIHDKKKNSDNNIMIKVSIKPKRIKL